MQNRAKKIGASLAIRTDVGGGTAIVVRLQFECLEVEFKQMLDALPNAFVRVIAGVNCRASAVRWPRWIRPSERFAGAESYWARI
jgi:hypothetical protein